MPDPTSLWPQTLIGWGQVSLAPIVLFSAALAAFQLRKNVLQSRAAFLLELETKWDRIESSRMLARKMHDSVRAEVFKEHSSKRDAEQEKHLRKSYVNYLNRLKINNPVEFTSLTEYWGFYETVGLMVRKRYIPFKIVYLLYKGPLIEIDRACTEFVKEWQGEAHTPSGLYDNMLRLAKRATKRERRENLLSGLKFWRTGG